MTSGTVPKSVAASTSRIKWLNSLGVEDLLRHENESYYGALLNHSAFDQPGTSLCYWTWIKPKKWDLVEVVDYLLTGPLLVFFILVGIIGGIVCIVTFWRGYRKMRLYVYLLALASWDVFCLVLFFYLYALPTLVYQEIVHFGSLVILSPIVYYLGTVARVGCIWTVWIIAVERYVALCHPFKFEAWTGSRFRGSMVFAIVAVCSLVFCLPRYFEVEVDYCLEISELEFVPRLSNTHLRTSFTYWLLYRVFGGLLLSSLCPFLTLVILTVKISVEIRKMSARIGLPEHTGFNKDQKRASRVSTNSYKRPSLSSIFKTNPASKQRPAKTSESLSVKNARGVDSSVALLSKQAVRTQNQNFNIAQMVEHNPLTQTTNQRRASCHPINNKSSFDAHSLTPFSTEAQKLTHSGSNGEIANQHDHQDMHRRASEHAGVRLNQWMHVAMIIKFLTCHTFPVLLDIWELIVPSVTYDRSWQKPWHLMIHLATFLVAVNSSCNFFIYFATSERFRADCRHQGFSFWRRSAKSGARMGGAQKTASRRFLATFSLQRLFNDTKTTQTPC